MVVLTGENLGERHRELNFKVAQVIANKINFNDIKNEEEKTDVDKVYKIDIASQYKDIDYIIEVLKSGDSLYVTRALKCLWLYHDSYNNIVNAEYLHVNIFPAMSIKMKKNMLSTISIHIRNSDRASSFFIYCNRNSMPNIAFKFLNLSSEEFKLNVLKNESLFKLYLYIDKQRNLHNFVGNSFLLASTCIEMMKESRRVHSITHNLRYLYAISSKEYLDIVEKYEINKTINRPFTLNRFGIRISRDIMLKHKSRVLENPLFYINKLNKCMLVKYSSVDDAKIYIERLMLSKIDFWEIDFCTDYDHILNLIPINERFQYMKQLFTTRYPDEGFEMTEKFYNLKYYNFFTVDQREIWALRHIEEQKEILGSGNDYIWYKFVNIDKALIEINKYIMITTDNAKRSCIVNVLVEAARDQEDLKKVLDYYYKRHVNENKCNKEYFIDKVLSVHNAFEFNIDCWEALNKLFYSLDIYSAGGFTNKIYTAVAVICHILHKKDMPQVLVDFIDLDINYSYFSLLLPKLSKEKSDIVLQYLLNVNIDKLKPFDKDPYNRKVRDKFKKYVNNVLNLLSCFQKENSECPEIVKKFMEIQSSKPKEAILITAKDIFRFLKTDVRRVINILGQFYLDTSNCNKEISKTLKKLKVYFHNDAAQEYINFLDSTIQKSSHAYNSKLIDAAIFGIFQLADESFKVALMEKYQPSQPKIDHSNIDRKVLYVQQAICKFVGYSRPPVPLKFVIQYIKGDYVHYCLPIFNMYAVNLPLPKVIEFIKGILDAPLSIQKQGLYLAFKFFTSEDIKTLILNTWKKSKNVSLRWIIYKSLFDKLSNTSKCDDSDAIILYDALKYFTSDLHQDDHKELFEIICSARLPDTFKGDYLQTAWDMVIKLPTKSSNIDRQTNLLRSIERNLWLVERNFVRQSIIDKYVKEILEIRKLCPDKSHDYNNLWNAVWNLTAKYIIHYIDGESLTLISLILKNIIEMWNDKPNDTYVSQNFFFNFIECIKNKSLLLWFNEGQLHTSIPILQHILDMLKGALPLKEIYLIVWDIKVLIFIRQSLCDTNTVLFHQGAIKEPLSHEAIKTLSDTIAKYLKKFVQELLLQNQFYQVFLPEIAQLLKNNLWSLAHNINSFDITFCESLADIGLKETNLLVLMILKNNVPEQVRQIHSRILRKIQIFENEEIQSYLHFKFMSTH